MSGDGIAPLALSDRSFYVLVGISMAAAVVVAPDEVLHLLTQPLGFSVVLGIVTGFLVKKSMSLAPWALLSVGLVVYGVVGFYPSAASAGWIAQLVIVATAAAVCVFQLRVMLVSGAAALRTPRTRWGSTLVALTATGVVIALGVANVPSVRVPGRETAAPHSEALPSRYTLAAQIGRVEEETLVEISGVEASSVNPGVFWAHNDSGHPPRLHCFYRRGNSCGTWNIADARNYDWEDLAIGPGPTAGKSYLYVGDIGDNSKLRDVLTIYRFEEPKVGVSSHARSRPATVPSVAIRLRYPDGRHDAETLLVHPQSGDLYIVTKGIQARIYKAGAPFANTVSRLERVRAGAIAATLSDVTGGDISADGSALVLTSYQEAYELVLPENRGPEDQGFGDIWDSTPAEIDTGRPAQLEAITYSASGASLFFVPEGKRSPIFESQLSTNQPVRKQRKD